MGGHAAQCSGDGSQTSSYFVESRAHADAVVQWCVSSRSEVISDGSESALVKTLEQLWCLVAYIQGGSALVLLLDSQAPEVR